MDQRSQSQDRPEEFVARGRPRGVGGQSWVWITITCYAIAMLLCLTLTMGGMIWPTPPWDPGLGAAAGVLGIALLIATFPPALRLCAREVPQAGAAPAGELADAVRRLSEMTALSDDARRVLNRRTERDVLCHAIEEDIRSEEWDAAVVLCNELANRFGYRAEAEDFRRRIDAGRRETVSRQLADAVASIEGSILQRHWDEAMEEARRIGRRFPESERAQGLVRRVQSARDAYRATLERQFLEAAKGEQVEEAMRLLKELDVYLSEEDAERYKEVARGVIGKARENLGARFKLAVHDREWGAAARIGRQIINEFPNTRMAHEVRRLLDGILTKANAAGNGGAAHAGGVEASDEA